MTALLGVGAFVGLNVNKEVVAAKATAAYEGSICIEFQNSNEGWRWDNDDAKIAFYAFNNTNKKAYGWSSMISTDHTSDHKYEIPYSFANDPFETGTQFHLVRYPSGHSDTPDWDNSNWGRYDNIGFCQVIYFWANGGSFQNQAKNYVNSAGSANNTRLSFNKFSSNVECYVKDVQIAAGEQFTIKFNNTDYSKLKNGVKSSFFTVVSSKIVCHASGMYDLYFDTNTKELWVQEDAQAQANAWATEFLTGVGCDAEYKSAPSNWSRYAETDPTKDVGGYSWSINLTNGAKELFVNADVSGDWEWAAGTVVEKAAYIHDMCVRKYAECSVFMSYTDEHGTHTRSASVVNIPNTFGAESDNNVFTMVIALVTVVSLTAVGGFFFLKKKKTF